MVPVTRDLDPTRMMADSPSPLSPADSERSHLRVGADFKFKFVENHTQLAQVTSSPPESTELMNFSKKRQILCFGVEYQLESAQF